MPPASKPTLHAKIASVQAELRGVGKDGKANLGSFSYDYVTEDALMALIRPLLADRGVASYIDYPPEYTNISNSDALITARLRLIDGDTGEAIELFAPGYAVDKGGKAAQKAMTGSARYLLWKGFLVPAIAGFDDDDQAPRRVERAPVGVPSSPSGAASTPAPPAGPAQRIRNELGALSGDEKNRLWEACLADAKKRDWAPPTTRGAATFAAWVISRHGEHVDLLTLLDQLEAASDDADEGEVAKMRARVKASPMGAELAAANLGDVVQEVIDA